MIRKAIDDDVKAIFDIFSETKTPWSDSGILSSIEKDEFFVYDDGGIKGCIAFSCVQDEGEVLNFAVKSGERGQGIGEKLLSFGIESLKDKEVSVFYLDVRESNLPAISLYEKLGFVHVGKRKNFYKNPCEDALLMTLYIK